MSNQAQSNAASPISKLKLPYHAHALCRAIVYFELKLPFICPFSSCLHPRLYLYAFLSMASHPELLPLKYKFSKEQFLLRNDGWMLQ
jgi:hypothetical protein